MEGEDSEPGKSGFPDSECKRGGLKDRLVAQTRREKALRRKKLLRLALIIAVAITAFLLIYPHLKVMWYIERAQSSDTDVRKVALQWLAERQVKKAVPVFIKALERTRGESEDAMVVLRTLAGKEIIPELIKIWESRSDTIPGYAKYNALQLIAEKGDKSHTPIFVDTRVLLDKGWGSAWDFLRKHADASTVEMILGMLSGDDVLKRRAGAMALRPIKEMDIVKKNKAALDALSKAIKDPDWVVRREVLITIFEIAREKDIDTVVDIDTVISALLGDEKPVVRSYAADVLGELRDPRAIPGLVRSLKDPEKSVYVASADALVKIGNSDCTGALGAIIKDEKEGSIVRMEAIGVLRRINAPGAAQILASVLGSAESSVAIEAARALARVGTPNSVAALAEAAKSANSELRVSCAYALGLIGEPAAQEALLHLLEDSELQVVREAAHALLFVGSPAYADKAVDVFGKLGLQSENCRKIASLLASYRTPKSISTLIDSALSAYPELREEARAGLNAIGQDVLSNMGKKKSYAREIVLSSAEGMFSAEAGSRLAGVIKSMPAQQNGQIDISSLTSVVLKAIRDLPERNEIDRDGLEGALISARTFYWTVTLMESLKAAGNGEEKIISQAQELVSATSEAEPFERVPTGETASRLRKIAKELNLPSASREESR
jgi:HEAT repeat protein